MPLPLKKGALTEQCVLFIRLFDKKLKAGKVLLLEGGTANVMKHHSRGIKSRKRVTQ